VNAAVNELLVARAIQELDPRPGVSILDLYSASAIHVAARSSGRPRHRH